MSDQSARTGGCWRPDAAKHCCGLRNNDGTWRVPGLGSAAALDSREAMTWNREVVRREEENVRLRAEIERLQIVEIASATITDVARLRGWLTEALQGWQDADEAMYDERIGGTPVHDPRIDEIRAEVGQA